MIDVMSLVTGAAILSAVPFNILPEILSGPLDLARGDYWLQQM